MNLWEVRAAEDAHRRHEEWVSQLREKAMPLIEQENVRVKELRAKQKIIKKFGYGWFDHSDEYKAVEYAVQLMETEINKVKEDAFKAYVREEEARKQYEENVQKFSYRKDTWKQ